jgi:hypothetical protein
MVALALIVMVAVLGVVADAAPAAAQPVPPLPTPSPSDGGGGVCLPLVPFCAGDTGKVADTLIPGSSVAGGAVDLLAGQVAGAARGVAAAAVAWYADTLISAAAGIVGEFEGFVDATTRPRVAAGEFLQPGGAYHMMASISVMLLIGFVFLGVMQGLASGEPQQALFRLLRDIPIAVLAIVGFPWLVDQLLAVADGLAAGILPSGGTTKQLLSNELLEALKVAAGGGLAQLLIAVAAFAALVLVYLEMVVRDVLIYLVVGLAPLSYAAFVWPAARGAARKVAEFAAAAILAKPAIFLALRIGLDLTTSHGEAAPWKGAPWGRLLVGLAVVCVAAFTPWVIWRLIPHAEAMLVSQGLSRAPARSAMQTLQTAYWLDAIRSRTSFGQQAGRTAARGGGPSGPGSGGGLPGPPGGRGPGAGRTPSPIGGPPSGTGGAGVANAGASGGAAAGAGAAGAAAGPAGAAAAVVAAGVQATKAAKDHVTTSAARQAASVGSTPATATGATEPGPAASAAGSSQRVGRPDPAAPPRPSAGWSRRPPPSGPRGR